jgi:hypothetical protein
MVSTDQWKPLSGGSCCGQPIGPPPPDVGYRITAPATSAQVQPWLELPIRLHNDAPDDLIGTTWRTPWAAVVGADGLILAVTTVMRTSMHSLTIPAGSSYDWTAEVPTQLCRDRPLGAPREYLSAGTYQVWVDIDIHPGLDSWDTVFTVRGGPFDLLLDETRPD